MTRFFCPGRIDLAGNHASLHRGRVLAAAMDRGITAEAEPNDEGKVRIFCEGFDPIEVDLSRLWPDEKEQGDPTALVRGMAGELAEILPELRGFDAYLFNGLSPRRGMSSSSAFCVLIGFILSTFSGVELPAAELAHAAQKAEARWFGKVSGPSEPLVCALGGGVYVDIQESKVRPVDCDFDSLGLALCLTDTGRGVEADRVYAQIAADMAEVAEVFGVPFLAKVRGPVFDEEWQSRQTDPRWITARHFFDETWRVSSMADALGLHDGQRFMELMNQSGRSSEKLLRGVWTDMGMEGLIQGLDSSETLLAGRGAWRAHSGGFGGYIQALMPEEYFDLYQLNMDRLFGKGACMRIHTSTRGVCLAQQDKILFRENRGFPEEAASLLD